jgi:hypothetical protein
MSTVTLETEKFAQPVLPSPLGVNTEVWQFLQLQQEYIAALQRDIITLRNLIP